MGDGQNYAMNGHWFSKFRNAMPLVLQHRPCGAICSSKSALRGHLFLKIGPAGPFVLTNQPCGATNYANLPNGLNIAMIGRWFIKTEMGASGVFNAGTAKPFDQQVGPAVYHATINQHPFATNICSNGIWRTSRSPTQPSPTALCNHPLM